MRPKIERNEWISRNEEQSKFKVPGNPKKGWLFRRLVGELYSIFFVSGTMWTMMYAMSAPRREGALNTGGVISCVLERSRKTVVNGQNKRFGTDRGRDDICWLSLQLSTRE